MCGITGYFNLPLNSEARLPLLRKMCDAIAHRGPDDDGYYADEMAGLGMRRLSIIDLNSGHQPISNADDTKQIVFNGEIYNYQEVRQRLLAQGYQFKTASDTEVILHQYEQDGADGINQLNGMFGIAVWDRPARRLFLARDRMGVKPLYYFWDGKHFLFASEIKALLASGYVPREMNQQALWDYLTFRYVPQPETIWKNVRKLLPGHTLTISADQPEPVIQRYWDIPYTDLENPRSAEDYLEEFESLFLDAVRLRLIADVPVGILLSGGLDSSAVAAAVREVHNARIDSFSVAFKDSPATDERVYARVAAERVGTEHHEIVIDERDFMEFLPRFVHFSDEPIADLASVPLHYVSSLARQKVKVVLSGEGSDEILGGYDFDRSAQKWERLRLIQRLPLWLRRDALARLLRGRAADLFELINTPVERLQITRPFNMTDYLNSDEKSRLLKSHASFRDSLDVIRADAARVKSAQPLHQTLYVYCQSWLVEDLLMKADKMTMANSIELRVPFLDYRLVEWAARVPAWVKVGRGKSGRYETKRVLRNFASKRLPASIITRPKQGFPVPVYDWLENKYKDWATDLLTAKDAKIHNWMEPEVVDEQLQAGLRPASPHTPKQQLWNLLILELWMREWNPS
jgi:asparagine synthase (glutamine-hydrolysing)